MSLMRLNVFVRAGLVAAGLFAAESSAFAYMTYPTSPTYPPTANMYGRPTVSAIPRESVSYYGPQQPGTVIVSTSERRLYLIGPDHQALKYGIGVGRQGFTWSGVTRVAMKKEWPDWTPPAAMLRRRPDLPRHMKGGIENPLGARALYLGASEFRIHGSNEPDTIGQAVSSGCIRMTNDDVKDLYERVPVGAKVVVEN
jgi:lipoprotein-anchoring transpeptidase ErfK/SrfK